MHAHVFANNSVDDEDIYPVTVTEIADAQREDQKLKHLFDSTDRRLKNQKTIIDDTVVLVRREDPKDRPRLIIPDSLQEKVIRWYHHYLQHPGRDCMSKTIE